MYIGGRLMTDGPMWTSPASEGCYYLWRELQEILTDLVTDTSFRDFQAINQKKHP